MPKRLRSGGVKDVNPQFMSFSGVQSGNDTRTVTTITLPIDPLHGGTSPTIIEVLKVFFEFDNNAILATGSTQWWAGLGTRSTGAVTTDQTSQNPYFGADPQVFAFAGERALWAQATGAGLNFSNYVSPLVFDCTDGLGHGILIATPNIYLTIYSVATAHANVARVKLMYRYRTVGIQEYIGIVQSQQSSN
jgi:hypothetical protein